MPIQDEIDTWNPAGGLEQALNDIVGEA